MRSNPTRLLETVSDWLKYYRELRSYKDNMEDRFVSLLFQQSVLALGSVSIILAIHEKLAAPLFGLPIGVLAAVAILLYSGLTSRYFGQIKEVGIIMARIEENHLGLPANYAAKMTLTEHRHLAIFAKGRAHLGCELYTATLMVIVVGTAAYVPFLTPRTSIGGQPASHDVRPADGAP